MNKWAVLVLIPLMGGCQRAMLPLGSLTGVHKDGTILFMGQSNARLLFQNAGPQLLRQVQDKLPGISQEISCAADGTYISEWQKGGTLYNQCLAQAQGVKVSLIIFWQGEANANPNTGADQWAFMFQRAMTNFRTDAGLQDVEVLYARLGDDPTAIAHYADWNLVRTQQSAVSLPNTEMINLDGIRMGGEMPHYETASYTQLAERFNP